LLPSCRSGAGQIELHCLHACHHATFRGSLGHGWRARVLLTFKCYCDRCSCRSMKHERTKALPTPSHSISQYACFHTPFLVTKTPSSDQSNKLCSHNHTWTNTGPWAVSTKVGSVHTPRAMGCEHTDRALGCEHTAKAIGC